MKTYLEAYKDFVSLQEKTEDTELHIKEGIKNVGLKILQIWNEVQSIKAKRFDISWFDVNSVEIMLILNKKYEYCHFHRFPFSYLDSSDWVEKERERIASVV